MTAPTDETFTEALARWFRELPPGAVVGWTGDGGSIVPGAYSAWVDVVIVDACRALGTNWLMTFVAPDDEQSADDDHVVEPDLTMWWVFGPGALDEFAFVLPVGQEPTVEQIGALEAVAAQDAQRRVTRSVAWSIDVLTRELADWVVSHTRRADLVFEHIDDVETPSIRRVKDAIDDDHYDFAPGMRISESALDKLLALDPNEAARLSTAIIDSLTPFVSDPDKDAGDESQAGSSDLG